MTYTPFNEWFFPNGKRWAQFFRTEDGYLVKFENLAEFWISKDGVEIQAYPSANVSTNTVEHLRLNQVLPLALSRQFKLVLHGGAVEINHQAVAFLGSSGAGKSTLTASFATQGFRFLTDDGLQLDIVNGQYVARPSHPSIRLWDDSYQTLISETTATTSPIQYTYKLRLLAGSDLPFCPESKPLQAIYFLGKKTTENIAITPVSPREAMIELVKHSFLLDVEEEAMLSYHFRQLADLVGKVNIYRLDYPRQYEYLLDARNAVINATALQSALLSSA